MVKTQEPRKTVVYGICTNTGGKEDGTPCLKCKNKEVQAIRASKDFICEECGEPLTKIDYRPRPKWPLALLIALAVIVCGVGAYFAFFRGYEENKSVSLTLNKESITLNVGECDTLMASVSTQPIDAVVSVIFISDNCNIAQVDSSGVIRAISIGKTNITVVAKIDSVVVDTALAKIFVDKKAESVPPSVTPPTPIQTQKRLDYGWYTWNGGHMDGKPHGKGTMKVTQTHTIELHDITGSKITVYPGESINALFEQGRLRGGDIIHKDGSSTTFINII